VGGVEGDPQAPDRGMPLAVGGERRKENIEAIRRALEPELQAREKRAREEGIKEGQSAVRAEVDQKLAAFHDAMALALKQFAGEREDYFHRVEGHVVRLALAIARKILHREAQIDPLLLAAAVRVALEKISSATTMRLYVHPDHVQIWREYLDHQSDMRKKPDVLGDATIAEGQCRIESSIGAADLSLEKQMTEIERGFFDLLAQRPDNP
jgi:flagellar assembly protein FliH